MLNSETTIKNYQALLNRGKLCAATCSTCNSLILPPKLFCPNCNNKTTKWTELSGRGRLRSFTIIHIAGITYGDEVPYIVAIVGLEEGPSICARLVGLDPLKPEAIHVGDAVIADFEEITDSLSEAKRTRLVFRPA